MTAKYKLSQPEQVLAGLLGNALASMVMDAIEDAGGEARFVGGVVRDGLLGKSPSEPKDIDMASTLPPERAGRALEAAGLQVIPTGIEHGTVSVRRKGAGDAAIIELTTLREDIETDGRRAKVRFGSDWRKDAERRDFTINSMSLGRDGALFDPFEGVRDLMAGKVRFVGEPRLRIQEDYLRILRFFRFYARFGKGRRPDTEAMAAITELAVGLERISGERVAKEMLGILQTGKMRALWHMVHTRVDSQIAPTGFRPEWMGSLYQASGIETSPAFRLGFLVMPADVDHVIGRLRLSKREVKQVELGSLDLRQWARAEDGAAAWRRFPWRADNPMPEGTSGNDLACLYVANSIRHGREADSGVVRELLDWTPPMFPVTGEDLLKRGVPAGKKLGDELRRLQGRWVDADFKPGRGDLLNEL